MNTHIPLSLHKARVIHANKFSEASGGAFNLPVSSTLYTDVVFRLADSGEDYKTYIKNVDLPIYTEQDVIVVCSGRTVIGYVDSQTNYYYYTTRDFCELLGIGLPSLWVWVIGILGAVVLYFINSRDISLWLLAPFLAVFILYLIQKVIFNYKIKKQVDSFLQ